MKKLLISVLILLPTSVFAAGVEVSPPRLEIEVEEGQQTQQEITVSNPTADVLLFDVYADDFTDIITASPASFTLESGARKVVELVIEGKGSPRRLTTNISIVSRPLADSRFQANTGVKIPLELELVANIAPLPRTVFYIYVAVAIILMTGYFIFQKLKSKKHIN